MLLRRHELDGAIMRIDSKPGLTPGNKLFLYGFLRDAIGCGKQTFLPRVDEALAAEGLTGADLGFPDTRALMEELAEFAKLTAFKGGRAYVTLAAMPEWDAALEAATAGGAAGKGGGGGKPGKPWKRKKGVKALKPQRPRRVVREPCKDEGAPETTGPNGTGQEAGKPAETDASASATATAGAAAREAAASPSGAEAISQAKGDVETAAGIAVAMGAEAIAAMAEDGSATGAGHEAPGFTGASGLGSGADNEVAGASMGAVAAESPQPAGSNGATESPRPAAPVTTGIALTVTYDPYTGDEGETVLVANAKPATGRVEKNALDAVALTSETQDAAGCAAIADRSDGGADEEAEGSRPLIKSSGSTVVPREGSGSSDSQVDNSGLVPMPAPVAVSDDTAEPPTSDAVPAAQGTQNGTEPTRPAPAAPAPEPSIKLTITYDPSEDEPRATASDASPAEPAEGTVRREPRPRPFADGRVPNASTPGDPSGNGVTRRPSGQPARTSVAAGTCATVPEYMASPVPEPSPDGVRAPLPASAAEVAPATRSTAAAGNPAEPAPFAGARPAASTSDARPDTAPSCAALAGYPRDFARDVHFPGTPLSDLARAMPIHADTAALLTEDFRIARGLGTVRGTRARATFPLRFAGVDGEAVTVTIKRHPDGAQPWTIDRIDGLTDGLLADAGIDGLPLVPDGPWFRAAADPAEALAASPLRRAAARCEVGADVLRQLADLAYPQVWSPDELRIQVSCALAAALGSVAEGDAVQANGMPRIPTGLFDALGRPIDALLEPTGDDIPWRLTGFEPQK